MITGYDQPGFRHSALILDSDQSVGQVLGPAVRRALGEADAVIMVIGVQTARLLREELGARAEDLEWGDTSAFYQRLGFAYESFRRLLATAHAAGRRIHVFAQPELAHELDRPGAVDRAAAFMAYEAICNETYAGFGCDVTCVWDARGHSSLTIENVRVLHKHVLGPAGWEPSPEFVAPRQYLAGRNQLPLPLPAQADWHAVLFGHEALPGLRAELEDWAHRHGFAAPAAADVVLAVNEIATNGLVHGRPPVQVHGWRHRDTLIVQVDDEGGTPVPALAGYQPPSGLPLSARGLWLARQLADVLQTRTTDACTSVRLYFPRQLTHRIPPAELVTSHPAH